MWLTADHGPVCITTYPYKSPIVVTYGILLCLSTKWVKSFFKNNLQED